MQCPICGNTMKQESFNGSGSVISKMICVECQYTTDEQSQEEILNEDNKTVCE